MAMLEQLNDQLTVGSKQNLTPHLKDPDLIVLKDYEKSWLKKESIQRVLLWSFLSCNFKI